jgi:hypothetical protein
MAQTKKKPCYESCQNGCEMYEHRKKQGFVETEPHPLGNGIPYAA